MSVPSKWACAAAFLALLACHHLQAQPSAAARKTVCTITVNSPDEKETFRRHLPSDEYQFVELVERGSPHWLASACQSGVRCDALLISGHFDGGDQFYTDRLEVDEFLPVAEMERAACSESCPGLFAQLKEVYLFGCNTLNPDAMRSASAEIARSLVRSGHSPADAERISRMLADRHGESNRDRMRHIFKDVPVIYGFSSKAPLGRYAGPILERYFESGAGTEVASGKPSAKLVGLFAASSMTVASGITDMDPRAGFRRDMCRFSDDRLPAASKLGFVHSLMDREMAEVRMFLDHLEKYTATLDDAQRNVPSTAAALVEIAHDRAARDRYLEFARDADEPGVRARMLSLARALGWLTPDQHRAELVAMFAERVARNSVGSREVDLACSLNQDRQLSEAVGRLQISPDDAAKASNAAMLACLGSKEGHAQVLRALTSSNEQDVEIAQIYLRYRPLVDAGELRAATAGIARMSGAEAQVRALDTLASQSVSDRESLEALARLFPVAKSLGVQRAIAGILIRSDYRAVASPDIVRALREHRLKSPDGPDVIDVLIRRMQTS